MNSELRKARNQRNMWRARHFKFRKNKTYRYKYVYWRNKVVSINRRSIREYFDKRCNESNNPKSFYKTILPYISTNNQSNGRKIILRETDDIVSSPLEVAEIFNVYYKSLSEYDETPDSLSDLK